MHRIEAQLYPNYLAGGENTYIFKFHMLKDMKKLTSLIEVAVSDHLEETAYISDFRDMEDPDGSKLFEPGHVCEIVGHRIKIEGNPAEVGLWMVPALDATKAVKITRVVSNNAMRIEFIPETTGHSENRLEIRTRYSGAPAPLAALRTITSPFVISEV